MGVKAGKLIEAYYGDFHIMEIFLANYKSFLNKTKQNMTRANLYCKQMKVNSMQEKLE